MRVVLRLHGFPELGRDLEPDVPASATGADLLEELGIPTESVLLFRGDDPLPIDEALQEGETLRILRIVSGG